MKLSDAQSEIVYAPLDQAIQVLAAAGAGKTRVLTQRVKHILESTKKDCVVALTFTNKAAEEMQVRLVDCADLDERAWISTIHSVAQRILEKYGHTIGLPNELHIYERDKDRMEVFLQSLRDDGVDIDEYLNVDDKKEQKSREQNLQRYMDGFSVIKRELLSEEDIEQKFPDSPSLWKIYQDYQVSLINGGGIDYDDILVYAHRILLTHDWVAKIYRAKYKHVCVDEAQDLNRAQYEFIKVFCGESIKSLFMVGDPNQMIYGFNGSSAEYFLTGFIKDFNAAPFVLNENFRSSKAVIRAANKLKPGSQIEHQYALDGGLTVKDFDSETSEADWIVSTIQYLLTLKSHDDIEGDITLDKMVVIARNRFVFGRLEDCLKKNAIQYSLRKGERTVEPASSFGKVLDFAIRIKVNPKDWVDSKSLCAHLGIQFTTLSSQGDLFSQLVAILGSDQKVKLNAELLTAISSLDAEKPNILKFVKDFEIKLKALADDIPKESVDPGSVVLAEELKRSLDELMELSACWLRFRRKGLGESLIAFRNALALGQLTDETINQGLTLSTVHTMKGLEKDIVFLMGMCEGVFPDYRAKTKNEIDEERNNAFVAVTRAKRWLYISYPKQRLMPWGDIRFQQQSRFVREISQ